jgi:Zn-dependent peptidase ImmA (M78 family)
MLYEDDPLFLVTGAYTDRQKMERAFAAELLAPAKGIAERLGGTPDVVLLEDLEEVAQYFRVSPMVVEHQVENQLSASIIG